MRQWKSLVPAALHLHGPAASCFPHPPSPSPCPSPPRAAEEETNLLPLPLEGTAAAANSAQAKVVRLVGCDGRVRAYAPPVTARELMQEHPRHLVCRADALLIGERIPAVAAGEELQPGEAYFLLPAHLFRSVLSFVSLASSLLLLLSSSSAAASGNGGKKPAAGRPFELHRTASGTLQIKFSDDFLLAGGKGEDDDGEADAAAQEEDKEPQQPAAVLLRGDARLAKDYEELVGYGKSHRWAPKLETIEEAVAPTPAAAASSEADPAASPRNQRSRKSRALPFLGRLGSRRRSRDRDAACNAVVACSG